MEERKYLVYKHTSPSGKVYIGITKQTAHGRWKNGLGYTSSPHFWSAIQKYGWDNFQHEIVQDHLTEDEACELEQMLIAKCNATNREYGYNQKTGGEKGSCLNADARLKLSASCKRFYDAHPEVCKHLSEKNRGYKHTEEAKAKMREAAKSRHYVLTDEWKSKIGRANQKKILEDKNLYEDTCERCRKNGEKAAKSVVQLDLDGNFVALYQSGKEAGRTTGIRDGNIVNCCKGRQKSSGGYIWQYANDYNSGREAAI